MAHLANFRVPDNLYQRLANLGLQLFPEGNGTTFNKTAIYLECLQLGLESLERGERLGMMSELDNLKSELTDTFMKELERCDLRSQLRHEPNKYLMERCRELGIADPSRLKKEEMVCAIAEAEI